MTTKPTIPDPLEVLRQINHNLRSALIRLRPEHNHCSNLRPRDFSALLEQITLAAECLRRSPSSPQAGLAFQQETLAYRRNLENLKNSLPDLHLRLLAEKSRLERARTNLASATAWAQARKNTL
jgi:hypothetical protein